MIWDTAMALIKVSKNLIIGNCKLLKNGNGMVFGVPESPIMRNPRWGRCYVSQRMTLSW